MTALRHANIVIGYSHIQRHESCARSLGSPRRKSTFQVWVENYFFKFASKSTSLPISFIICFTDFPRISIHLSLSAELLAWKKNILVVVTRQKGLGLFILPEASNTSHNASGIDPAQGSAGFGGPLLLK
mmetsp:Transcript_30918/g.75406  ORF Transcript_30918/g.75406 Transcript_30918/m.75406 type:complete len:129 (+) Transcript_30918:186-572(+)